MIPGYHFFASTGYSLVRICNRIVFYVVELRQFNIKQLFIHKPY